MFDCPDATHTSPTTTPLISIAFLPAIQMFIGLSDAVIGGNSTSHLPSAVAVVRSCLSPSETWISSPGSAQPQTGIFAFCCITMLEPKMAGIVTSATAGRAATNKLAITRREASLRMVVIRRSLNKYRSLLVPSANDFEQHRLACLHSLGGSPPDAPARPASFSPQLIPKGSNSPSRWLSPQRARPPVKIENAPSPGRGSTSPAYFLPFTTSVGYDIQISSPRRSTSNPSASFPKSRRNISRNRARSASAGNDTSICRSISIGNR